MSSSAGVVPSQSRNLLWLLASAICLLLGVVGLVVYEWSWAGAAAGIGGTLVAVQALRAGRQRFLIASLGMFLAIAVVDGLVLTGLGGSETTVPLVLGSWAALAGLVAGAVVAEFTCD
jgi:hypothetical protein